MRNTSFSINVPIHTALSRMLQLARCLERSSHYMPPIGMIKLELVLERFRLLCSDCILTPRGLKPAAQGNWGIGELEHESWRLEFGVWL